MHVCIHTKMYTDWLFSPLDSSTRKRILTVLCRFPQGHSQILLIGAKQILQKVLIRVSNSFPKVSPNGKHSPKTSWNESIDYCNSQLQPSCNYNRGSLWALSCLCISTRQHFLNLFHGKLISNITKSATKRGKEMWLSWKFGKLPFSYYIAQTFTICAKSSEKSCSSKKTKKTKKNLSLF